MAAKFFVVQDFEYVVYIGEHNNFSDAAEYADKEFPFSSTSLYREEGLRTMIRNAQDALEESNK